VAASDRSDVSAAAPGSLARGRAAHARRAWADAFTALTAADHERPLDNEDLDRATEAAVLSGQVHEYLRFGERAYRAHLETGERRAAALTAFWLGFRLVPLGELARANGWFSRARRIVECDGVDCVVRGFLLLAESIGDLRSGGWVRAEQLLSEAIAIGERFANPDLVTLGRQWLARTLLRQGKTEGLALLDEAMLAVACNEVSPVVAGLVYCGAIALGQRLCAFDRTREWTRQLSAWCDAQPQLVPFSGICLVHQAEILQLEGSWPEALDVARRAGERLSPATDPQAVADAWYQQAEIHRMRGDLGSAEVAFGESSRSGSDPQPGLSLLRLAQGRGAIAIAAIRRAAAAASEPTERLRLLPARVEIALAQGEVGEARGAAEELVQLAEQLRIEVVRSMADHAMGAVLLAEGQPQAALPPLRRAFEGWQRVGASYLGARLRLALAQACRALRDEDGARLELSSAREVFVRLGALPDLEATDRLLGAQKPVADAPGLTCRELEVLRLVAKGLTNKAIATALHLSEKTVDRHVSNIFAKIDVSSRAAATAFAYERGLVSAPGRAR
jgi:DNA-binding CsgD family transcriptional regulator